MYIADDLTKPRSRLIYLARTLKKVRNILDWWSFDGRIMIVMTIDYGANDIIIIKKISVLTQLLLKPIQVIHVCIGFTRLLL